MFSGKWMCRIITLVVISTSVYGAAGIEPDGSIIGLMLAVLIGTAFTIYTPDFNRQAAEVYDVLFAVGSPRNWDVYG